MGIKNLLFLLVGNFKLYCLQLKNPMGILVSFWMGWEFSVVAFQRSEYFSYPGTNFSPIMGSHWVCDEGSSFFQSFQFPFFYLPCVKHVLSIFGLSCFSGIWRAIHKRYFMLQRKFIVCLPGKDFFVSLRKTGSSTVCIGCRFINVLIILGIVPILSNVLSAYEGLWTAKLSTVFS